VYGKDRVEGECKGEAVGPEHPRGFMVEPVSVGKLVIVKPIGDIGIHSFVPFKGNVKKRGSQRHG
jgi:hypothetical protein